MLHGGTDEVEQAGADAVPLRCSSKRLELRGPVLPTLYVVGLPWKVSYVRDAGMIPGAVAGAVPAEAGAVPA